MALTPTVRATANNATDAVGPDVTTASFTPSNNSLLVAVALSQTNLSDVATTVISISGGGLTWTNRANTPLSGGTNMCGAIWTAPVTTGASMTVTITGSNVVNDENYGAVTVAVIEFTGYDTATPTGVSLAAVTGSRSGAYSPALSGTSAATSYVVVGGVVDFGTATKGSSWTEAYDGQAASGGTDHDFNVQ